MPAQPIDQDLPMRSLGDVIRSQQQLGELPQPSAAPNPATPISSASVPALPRPRRSVSTSDCPSCGTSGVVPTTAERARALRLIVVDTYYGDRAVAICPDCPAGAARAAAWSGLPDEARGIRLDCGLRAIAEQMPAIKRVAAFLAEPRGWLTLAGGYGVGKTTLIYAALNHLADVGIYGRYLTAPELLDELRDALRDVDGRAHSDRLKRLFALPVLAIDELDKYYATEYAEETIFKLFDARYRERATVATLLGYNLGRQERIPPFLLSRINDGRFELVKMHGPDLRAGLGSNAPA